MSDEVVDSNNQHSRPHRTVHDDYPRWGISCKIMLVAPVPQMDRVAASEGASSGQMPARSPIIPVGFLRKP